MLRRLFAVAALVALAACSHKADTATTTTTTNTGQQPSAAQPMQSPTQPALNSMQHAAPGGPLTQYPTESAAQTHCPSDVVVWLNTKTNVYHEKGTHYYGTTKHGAYVCEKEADAAGDRASKS
ncbi:MAG TPA: hypothetical protein VHT05_14735 [Candidatus Elarobacter sp.]|jgi:hypothetical protein|nr:hypothetical protein [Candidatus Elarobacter sp.]